MFVILRTTGVPTTTAHDLTTRHFRSLLRWWMWPRSRDRTKLFAKLASVDGTTIEESGQSNPLQSNTTLVGMEWTVHHCTGWVVSGYLCSNEYTQPRPRKRCWRRFLWFLLGLEKERRGTTPSRRWVWDVTVSKVGPSVARWMGRGVDRVLCG